MKPLFDALYHPHEDRLEAPPGSLAALCPGARFAPLTYARALTLWLDPRGLLRLDRSPTERPGVERVSLCLDDDPLHAPGTARRALALGQHLVRRAAHDARGALVEAVMAFELCPEVPPGLEAAPRALERARNTLTWAVERIDPLDAPCAAEPLSALLYPTVHYARARAAQTGAAVSTRIDADATLAAPARGLDAALRGLVDNALHHGQAQALTVIAQTDGDRLVIGVEDNGRGVAPAVAPHLGRVVQAAGQRGGSGHWFSVQVSNMLEGVFSLEWGPNQPTRAVLKVPIGR